MAKDQRNKGDGAPASETPGEQPASELQTPPGDQPGTPPGAPAAPEAPASETPGEPRLTPDAWGKKLGHFRKGNPSIPQQVSHFDWQHAGADKLYGWAEYAYNFQAEQFLITEDCYKKALAAAAQFPTVAPHAEAFPEPYKARFEGFQPKAKHEKKPATKRA